MEQQWTPAADEATESSWVGQFSQAGDEVYHIWQQALVDHRVMLHQRQQWGLPAYDADWTQSEDIAFWTLNNMTVKVVQYVEEVKRRARNVVANPSIKTIGALAMVGEPVFSYEDGVLKMSAADTELLKVSTKTPGIVSGWQAPVIVGASALAVVAISAAGLGSFYFVWQTVKERMAATRSRDLQKHTEDCLKLHTPEECKKLIDAETTQIVQQANAEAKKSEASELSEFMSAIKTIAVVAGVIGAFGGTAYVVYKVWPSGRSTNPTKGKAVAKHGGYVWGTTYETWDEESLEVGETDEKGWEYEFDHGPYKSLADLLQDIPGHSWLEWSSGRPGPHSWIISDKDQDRDYFEKGKSTYYSLFIRHADGTDLTQAEVNFVDKAMFGARRR